MKLLALGLLVAASAFSQEIEIESDQAADFTRYHSFAIRDGRLNSKNPSLNSDLVRKRLDADFQKYLQAKGLTFVPSGPESDASKLEGKLDDMVRKSFDKHPPKT